MKFKLLLSCILFSVYSFAQYPQWISYSSEALTSYSQIAFEGNYTWVGGATSLSRIDRTTGAVEIYDASNCFPFFQIESILVDSLGNKWIGTSWDGLLKFDNHTITQYRNLPSGDTLWTVRNLRTGPNGHLYMTAEFLGGSNTRVAVVEFDGTNFIDIAAWKDFCPGSTIGFRSFEIDLQGNIFITSSCGVVKYDGSNLTFYDSLNSPIGYNEIEYVVTDGKGKIWASDKHALYSFDGTSWTIHNDSISHMVAWPFASVDYDSSGNLYFLYPYSPRLFKLDVSGSWSEQFGILGNNDPYHGLQSIRIDSLNHIWTICNNFQVDQPKVYEWDGNGGHYYWNSKSGLPNSSECRLTIDRFNKKWIAGIHYISTYDGTSWDSLQPPWSIANMSSLYGANIETDKNNNVWIADYSGGNGILRFDGMQWSSYPFVNVFRIALQNNETPWVSVFDSTQLAYFQNGVWNYIDTSAYHLAWIDDICADGNNGIWLIGDNSIANYNGSVWSIYNNQNTPNTDSIYFRIKGDAYGGIWILAKTTLIRYFNGNWTEYPFHGNDWNSSLLIKDTNDIYIANVSGFHHFDGTNFTSIADPYLLSYAGQNYYDLDADQSGNVWVCHLGGIAVYNPNGVDPATIYSRSSSYISGDCFFDLNSNGSRDSLEPGAANQRIFLLPDSAFQVTDNAGHYHIAADSGMHVLQIQPINQWTLTTDSSEYNVQTDTMNLCCYDFGVTTDLQIDSVTLSLTGGIPRCNSPAPYWIDVTNVGTTYLTSVISVQLDPQVVYVSSNGDSIIGNTIYFHTDNLIPGQTVQFSVGVQMPPAAGTSLSTIAECQTSSMSVNTSLSQVVTCSFDPNEKNVQPEGIGASHAILNSQQLEYTIHFENCGTDTAFAIRIVDSLDANLDLNSFTFISASHPVQISCTGRVLTFIFNAPQLPFTQIDSVSSQGFVKFRIRPVDNLSNGTIIKNDADIYFDWNPPITTNETFNTIDNTVKVQTVNRSSYLKIYPVPADNQINMEISGDSHGTFELINDKGVVVRRIKFSSSLFKLDVKLLGDGIYFYRLFDDDSEMLHKGKIIILH